MYFKLNDCSHIAMLKDAPDSERRDMHKMIRDPEQDHNRVATYPNMEYGNLYNAIAMLLDVATNITTGQEGVKIENSIRHFFRFLRKNILTLLICFF